MLWRVMVGTVAACALIVADSAARAELADARLFKGKTAQGHGIKFAVKGKSFKILRFEADLKCRDGSVLVLDEGGFLWTRVARGGGFRDAQFGKTDSVYFRGRLNQRRIRGRVRLTDKLGKVRCRSRWIRFNATPR